MSQSPEPPPAARNSSQSSILPRQVAFRQYVADRFKDLLIPIRDLGLAWKIDVAAELNDYLDSVGSEVLELDKEGLWNFSFAEAALLIQGSAGVYSKKVESLYSNVFRYMETINSLPGKAEPSRGQRQRLQAADDDDHRDEIRFLLLDDDIPQGKDVDLSEQSVREPSLQTPLLNRAALLGEADLEGSCQMNTCRVHESGALILQETPLNNLDFGIDSLEVEGRFEAASGQSDSASDGMADADFDHNSLSSPPHDILQHNSEGDNDSSPQDNLRHAEESHQKTDCCDSHIQPESYDPFELYEPSEDKDMTRKTCNKRKYNSEGLRFPLVEFRRFTHAYDYDDANFFNAKSVRNDNSLGRLLRDMRRVHKLIRGFLSDGNEKARDQPDDTTRSAFIASERGAELESSKLVETVDASPPDGGSTEYKEDINDGGASLLDEEVGRPGGNFDTTFANNADADDDSDDGGDIGFLDTDADGPGLSEEADDDRDNNLTYADYVQMHVRSLIAAAAKATTQPEMLKRVEKWKDKISAGLALQNRNRHTFDVHSYGDQVLNALKSNLKDILAEPTNHPEKVAAVTEFQSVTIGADVIEVCRCFSACLQLANDGNIAWRHVVDGQISNELEIELVNENSAMENMELQGLSSHRSLLKNTMRTRLSGSVFGRKEEFSDSSKERKKIRIS